MQAKSYNVKKQLKSQNTYFSFFPTENILETFYQTRILRIFQFFFLILQFAVGTFHRKQTWPDDRGRSSKKNFWEEKQKDLHFFVVEQEKTSTCFIDQFSVVEICFRVFLPCNSCVLTIFRYSITDVSLRDIFTQPICRGLMRVDQIISCFLVK